MNRVQPTPFGEAGGGGPISPTGAAFSGGRRRLGVTDHVTELFHEEIRSGRWPVGERIPVESALVEWTGAGRNAVREAVQSLVQSGLVRREQGRGTFVIARSQLAQTLTRRISRGDRRDGLELRHAIDSSAAALAAERRTPADVATLRALLADRAASWAPLPSPAAPDAAASAAAPAPGTATAPRAAHSAKSASASARATPVASAHATASAGGGVDVARRVQADLALHRAIVDATHNPLYVELYEGLAGVFEEVLLADVEHDTDPHAEHHSRLVEAIVAGDPEAARRAIATLLDPLIEGEAAPSPHPTTTSLRGATPSSHHPANATSAHPATSSSPHPPMP
ncbi:FadR/GntR family transcriptional regulator [Herbiconiux liukaitaii]|uniref:FadR/GntR family transcriptional regulator n=1 Tax=Herbiconiux liukaitaii TaxID=3342799 RepID=UPI0035BA0FBA